jgi:hypothetical protein
MTMLRELKKQQGTKNKNMGYGTLPLANEIASRVRKPVTIGTIR